MSLNKSVLVMGGTRNMAFAMGVFLLSLKESNGSFTDEVMIFHDGITELEQVKLSRIYPVRFVRYDSPFEKEEHFWFPSVERFSLMVFCKYECLRLLREYGTVIWMDYDMLAVGDLSELLAPVKGGCRFILTRTMGDYLRKNFHGSQTMNRIQTGVHASTFALYDSLPNYEQLYQWCIEQTVLLARELITPEQMIMTLMIEHFHLSVYPIPFQLYSPRPDDTGHVWDKYVKIWHTYGMRKFWNAYHIPLWDDYLEEWKRL